MVSWKYSDLFPDPARGNSFPASHGDAQTFWDLEQNDQFRHGYDSEAPWLEASSFLGVFGSADVTVLDTTFFLDFGGEAPLSEALSFFAVSSSEDVTVLDTTLFLEGFEGEAPLPEALSFLGVFGSKSNVIRFKYSNKFLLPYERWEVSSHAEQ